MITILEVLRYLQVPTVVVFGENLAMWSTWQRKWRVSVRTIYTLQSLSNAPCLYKQYSNMDMHCIVFLFFLGGEDV